jgi:glycosyltransferase involved in cell wall biosynthesis
MADVQAAILSPVLYLMRRRHGLWYAHSHVSVYLRFAGLFVDFILTATIGSCNLKSKKVVVIGHGVDESEFNFQVHQNNRLEKILTVGRLDPSKHFEKILDFFVEAKSKFPELTLTSVGSPSTRNAETELRDVLKLHKDIFDSKSIKLLPSARRGSVSSILSTHDVFVHAYLGSLDKSILEATLCGIPVITLNYQYHEVFGVWGGLGNKDSLFSQYVALRSLSVEQLNMEIERRVNVSLQNHSLTHWSQEVVARLQNPG